jgi:Trypsin-like peptidase domain
MGEEDSRGLAMIARRRVVVGLGLIALVLSGAGAAWAVSDASIVRISVDLADGGSSYGSGCFWGDEGLILTAYHVVNGATKIRVYVNGTANDQVQVAAYAPKYDLVLLRIPDLPAEERGPGLLAGEVLGPPFTLPLDVEVRGHPVGWRPTYSLNGQLTQADLVSSTSIFNAEGWDIFAETIDLVGLDVTVYGGLSGAPVLVEDQVIGVLSGSLNEGGSITWAIPVKYVLAPMTPVGKPPEAITWPAFTLMKTTSLSRGLNLSTKNPNNQWAIHAGFTGRLDTSFTPDEFGMQLQALRDHYGLNLSYGFDFNGHFYGYDRDYPVMDGFDQRSERVTKYLAFANIFVVRKHFNSSRRPYYGVCAGLPRNAQVRVGFRFFSRFNLEMRGQYFRTEETHLVFNYFGTGVKDDRDTDVWRLMLGINMEVWPW